MSHLDSIHVRRLISKIRDDLKNGMGSFVFEPNDEHTRERVKASLENYLGSISAVKSYEVDQVKMVYHGWKELYPTLGKRILAWLGVKVFRVGTYTSEQRWYHTVLPFNISYKAGFKSEALQQDDRGGWIVHMEFDHEYADAEAMVHVSYGAYLRTPYETMDVDFKIQPMAPVEFVKVDLRFDTQRALDSGV